MFWIRGTTRRSIELSFYEIAVQVRGQYDEPLNDSNPALSLGFGGMLEAKPRPELLSRIVNAVIEWFARDGNKGWRLIFDDVDELQYSDIAKYFPPTSSGRGRIIITTRQQRFVGSDAIANYVKPCHVPPLDLHDAIRLIRSLSRQSLTPTPTGKRLALTFSGIANKIRPTN
jgi:hypothetical protein